jgi:hypothetical protein
MRRAVLLCGASLLAGALSSQALAVDTSGKEDRFIVMASGSRLEAGSITDNGWGASLGWLHNFNADTIFGIGGEHQTIGDADWNFGTLNLTHGFGQADRRTNLYLEGHQGTGKDAVHDYDYGIWAAGLYQNLTHQLSLQLEDKQIDVDTVHGNLPKLGVQFLWTPHLSTSVSYAHSVSGNLGTRIRTLRFDGYGKTMNYFAGAANGPASPVIINLTTKIPPVILHEYFIGVGKTFSRTDMTTLLDYQKLGATERYTLTFNFTVHRRGGG